MMQKDNLWKWLDENREFLINYLDNSPQDLLHEMGITRVKHNQFLRIAKTITAGMVVKKMFSQKPNIAEKMTETELFMELVKDIESILDVNVLCYKSLRNIATLTKSHRSNLFLTRGTRSQRYLVLKISVSQSSTFEESLMTEETEITLPFGKGIVGHVAQTKETISIAEAYDDPRFSDEVDKKTGYRTHSIMCKPILSNDGDCIGVAEIINKIGGKTYEFSEHDSELFERYLMFCGIGLTNAQLFEMSVNEYQRNQVLLNLAEDLFSEQISLEELVCKITVNSQEIANCERCSVYLLPNFAGTLDQVVEKAQHEKQYKSADDIVFSKAFHMYNGKLHIPSSFDLAHSNNARVARDVVFSKKHINISNLQLDSKYGGFHFVNKEDFRTKSILSMPIFDSKRRIIGVTQQMNKISTVAFNESDEQIIKAFSIFAGLGIHNCIMYENACRLMRKQKVALEVLSHHATARSYETLNLIHCEIPKANHWKIYTFEMDDLLLDDFDLAKVVIRMFLEMDIVKAFSVPYDVLCQWTLSVKKNYRPVTYHNWRHAFNVCQTVFTMLNTGGLIELFDDLEVFTMMVACLCHDLDHRGTNNAFQIKVDSPLATLYSTSVMEHHHFNQCVMLLNSDGNNIFRSLSSENYRLALGYIEYFILATDLAKYFEKKSEFQALVDNKDTDFKIPANKNIIKAMLMTACDLAATCKPWDIQFRTSILVTSEFFEQGDMELKRLGKEPMAIMDRKKKDQLPKLQIAFFDGVCLPLYELFSRYDPRFSPLYVGCKNNRKQWGKLDGIKVEKFIEYRQKEIKKTQLKRMGTKEEMGIVETKSKCCVLI